MVLGVVAGVVLGTISQKKFKTCLLAEWIGVAYFVDCITITIDNALDNIAV